MKPKIIKFETTGKIECREDGVHLVSYDSTKLMQMDFHITLEDMKTIADTYFPIYLESCPKLIEALAKFIESHGSSSSGNNGDSSS